MATVKKTQTVAAGFADDMIVQQVSIDTDEKWIVVKHSGNSLSMSIENWEKLVELYQNALEKSKS